MSVTNTNFFFLFFLTTIHVRKYIPRLSFQLSHLRIKKITTKRLDSLKNEKTRILKIIRSHTVSRIKEEYDASFLCE